MATRVFPHPPLERLSMLLERYISKILVRSVLKASCHRVGVGTTDVWPRDMERLVEEAMRGLRLWVPENRLPDLMIELAELCMEIEEERFPRPSEKPALMR